MSQGAKKDRHSRHQMEKLVADLRDLEARLRRGGGPEKTETQHRQGKLTARERIELLLDAGSNFLEIGLLTAFDSYRGQAPGAGAVTGVGLVGGREVMVIANDATVKAGAMWPDTVKKILRAQEIAMRSRVPVVYLVDSAGAFLPYQSGVFPGQYGGARVFYNNCLMRRYLGIPQIAAVMGPCIAGGAYLPALSDFIVMVEGSSFMGLGGPGLVKGATGQVVEAETLGGAQTHTSMSGVAHYRAANDEACILQIRKIVSELPRKADPALPLVTPRAPRRPSAAIYDILPADDETPYDLRALLDCLLDEGRWEEYGADRAPEMVMGHARIAGIPVGLLANQRGLIHHISSEVAAKVAGFVGDCNRQGTPLVFLQDVSGFKLSSAAERLESVGAGARLIEVMATAAGPRIVLAVSYTGGDDYFAIIAQVFDPDFIFALPTGPAHSVAARGMVDAVVAPEEVRLVLESALRTVLNNPGRHPGLLMLPNR